MNSNPPSSAAVTQLLDKLRAEMVNSDHPESHRKLLAYTASMLAEFDRCRATQETEK